MKAASFKHTCTVVGCVGGCSNLTNQGIGDHDSSYSACELYDAQPRLDPAPRCPRCANPTSDGLRQLDRTDEVNNYKDDDDPAPEYGHQERETKKAQRNEDGRGHRRYHRHEGRGTPAQV